MKGVRNDHAYRPGRGDSLASWYTPGHSDGFGDRLLMFDNTGGPTLELLRFRPDLSSAPGFEQALRERVRDLRSFDHPAFSPVRAVEHLDGGDRLALVSVHAPGQRLSEIFEQRPRKALHPRIVTWLLRELTPALAALHAQGAGVAHGALTPHRIVLTPEGRLCVVEHVLGSALRHLQFPPVRLWRDFALVAPPPNVALAPLDARADVIQLAGVALSMLLARPITFDDFRHRLPALLDEFSELSTSAAHHGAPLRLWLERALQVNGESYASAADAQQDLEELPTAPRPVMLAVPDSGSGVRDPGPGTRDPGRASETADILASVDEMFPSEQALPKPASRAVHPPPAWDPPASAEPLPPEAPAASPEPRVSWEELRSPAFSPHGPPRAGPRPVSQGLRRRRPWLAGLSRDTAVTIAAGVGVIAVVEAVVIALLAAGVLGPGRQPIIDTARAGGTVLVNGAPARSTPLDLEVGSDVRAVSAATAGGPQGVALLSQPSVPVGTSGDRIDDPVAEAAARQTSGGVRLLSPIPLTVLEGNRVLGTTDRGPVVASAGLHRLELVNEDLGYRATLPVTFRQGEIRQLRVELPMGRLNVNCQPWCNVFIEDRYVGETPLANIGLPIGTHHVVLRHPQFGERREAVTVRAEGVARLAVALQ